MESHPNLNDPVMLRDPSDREYRSRVEDLGDGLLVVARPHDLPGDEEFGNGTDMKVVWADSDGGITVMPTRILAAHEEGTLPVWSLLVTGPAVVDHRRRFVRVDAAGPVSLRPGDGRKGGVVRGSLVDVSEAAVRCEVGAGAADGFLGEHNDVVAEFRLGTVDFAVPGRVEFLRATKHPAQLEQLVVVFDEPVADAEALRKQVFAQEVRALRAKDEAESQAERTAEDAAESAPESAPEQAAADEAPGPS